MSTTAPIKDVKFFFAGKAIFTVSNDKGTHYTFKVSKAPSNPNFQGEMFFVSVMTGSDNESDYTYMGVLKRDCRIVQTKKTTIGAGDVRFKTAQWAINKVLTGTELPEGYAIRHAGRCCACGRLLTNPDSIDSGIGPECAKRAS